MDKNYDVWNKVKKNLNQRKGMPFAHPREIWWCSIGVNIGAEIDGKHESFERPVLILRVYNKETLLILPVTSKEKPNKYHCKIQTKSRAAWVALTQTRVISYKRLLRKLDTVPEVEFGKVRDAIRNFL